MVVNDLYRNAGDEVASSFTFDGEALLAALKRIYGKEIDPGGTIDEGLFRAVLSVFDQAVGEGFAGVPVGDRDADFREAIRKNNAVFSAFKVHRLQGDVAAQLLDENGRLKSFEQWLRDVDDILDHHVGSWLRTEYNTAVMRAHQAADWRQFEREADILPNLRWNESTSITPGLDHKIFWGRIFRIDHPFWSEHRPGDRWGCKCSLSATAEPETDNRDLRAAAEKPSPGLGGNPAFTAKLFSDDHPYIANAYKGAAAAVQSLLGQLDLSPEKVSERKFKSGGVLQIPAEFRQNSVEQVKNVRAYTELAKMHGERYKLLSVDNAQGKKNPDALNLKTGYYSDMKNPVTGNGKNAVQASIKAAGKQKVEEVYIFLTKKYPMTEIYRGLMAALQGGRSASLRTVIIRLEDGTLKRYNVDKIRQWLKN